MWRSAVPTRRIFLSSLLAAGLSGKVKPGILGANTAITGWSMVDAIRLLRAIGFPAIEIHAMGVPEAKEGVFPGFQFDKLSAQQKQEIRSALRGVPYVTAHLPYTRVDYFAKDPAMSDRATATVDTAIEGCAYFNVKLAVLHPKQGAGYASPGEQWPLMLQRFRHWGDLAQKHGMRIALETGYPKSVSAFVRLIQEVDHPAVGATIDVGHQSQYAELIAKVRTEQRSTPAAIRAYNDTTIAILDGLGKKAFHFHVHDIDPVTWQEHRPLGTNFVDYPRLFSRLNAMDYTGYLILEIGGKPEEMEGHLRHAKTALESAMKQAG